ncbi:probetacellulin [Manis javanica]|uniref:probetacellulin n=1 Tax=Manis javanica TaxID=9974 RepID=UPI003C6D2A56
MLLAWLGSKISRDRSIPLHWSQLRVVSFPAGSGIGFQALPGAPVARAGGAGVGGRLVGGLPGLAVRGSWTGPPRAAAPAPCHCSWPSPWLCGNSPKFWKTPVLPTCFAVSTEGAPADAWLAEFSAQVEGLVILHCVVADENSTRSSENEGLLCGDPGANCAATTTQSKRRGHFSRCPKQYKHYCIKGRCRFVVAEQTPSCICDEGYTGARCERVDLFYLRGDRGQILVICLIAVMVIFIILVIGVCTCCHPLRKRHKKRKKEEEMETLGKDITPVNEDIQETSIA